jgi:hypothetical protein
MSPYAENTQVPAGRSRDEIERTLTRYGAAAFGYAVQRDQAMIEFLMHGYRVRFVIDLPDPGDPQFTETETGRPRQPAVARSEYEKACRQRWRVLALVTKAKLEAVEAGVVTFQREFLPYIVLPSSGLTLGQVIEPKLDDLTGSGEVLSLLADYTRPALPSP